MGSAQNTSSDGNGNTIDKVTTKRLALYSGRTHPELAAEVAQHLGVKLGDPNIIEFANGEIRPRFNESIRGADVFIMQREHQQSESLLCARSTVTPAKTAKPKVANPSPQNCLPICSVQRALSA
jgi:hypothetical protein